MIMLSFNFFNKSDLTKQNDNVILQYFEQDKNAILTIFLNFLFHLPLILTLSIITFSSSLLYWYYRKKLKEEFNVQQKDKKEKRVQWIIKEYLQEYSVQKIINKVHIFLFFLIYFSNILKYDVNIYLSFLSNYYRINGWKFYWEEFNEWSKNVYKNIVFKKL